MLEDIVTYIRTQLAGDADSIGSDTNLTQDGHLDSTAMLELILWVGDTFNITIQSEELTPENFATPRHIMEFVQRHEVSEAAPVQRDFPLNVGTE
jgi:acyl carrier protein